jgi:hypothetical protein
MTPGLAFIPIIPDFRPNMLPNSVTQGLGTETGYLNEVGFPARAAATLALATEWRCPGRCLGQPGIVIVREVDFVEGVYVFRISRCRAPRRGGNNDFWLRITVPFNGITHPPRSGVDHQRFNSEFLVVMCRECPANQHANEGAKKETRSGERGALRRDRILHGDIVPQVHQSEASARRHSDLILCPP